MKIFATSDLHGQLEGLNPTGYDLVIIAGDIAPLKGFTKWNMYDQKKWIQKKFVSWMESYPNTQFVFVPGNHDLSLEHERTCRMSGFDWSIRLPENAHMLYDSGIELLGLKIYGTPWVPIISYMWAFEAEHDKLVKKFSKIPYDLDILITHAPPHISNCVLDYSLQTGNGPFGSNELTQALYDKQPRMCFCGHIHSGDHSPFKFDNCTIYNVSRIDECYEIAYEPTIVEVN